MIPTLLTATSVFIIAFIAAIINFHVGSDFLIYKLTSIYPYFLFSLLSLTLGCGTEIAGFWGFLVRGSPG
jgi:hypothetical protein